MRRCAQLLVLALLSTGADAQEIEFEIVPAIVTEPLEPVAGAPLTVRLEPDLIAPGRSLRLVDADSDLAIAEQRIAGAGIDRYTFRLPEDLNALAIELLEGEILLLRWPSEGGEPVWPPARTDDAAAFADDAFADDAFADDAFADDAIAEIADANAGRTRAGGETACTPLPPIAEDGNAALRAWLDACPLDHASLPGRALMGVDLAGRILRRADLREADLSDARLAGTDLFGASLFRARLDGADLSGAELEIADLSHASLFVADLGGANLRGADLRNADLTDANLANSDLTGARLAGARLDATDFSGAICPDGYRTEKRCDAHLQLP